MSRGVIGKGGAPARRGGLCHRRSALPERLLRVQVEPFEDHSEDRAFHFARSAARSTSRPLR